MPTVDSAPPLILLVEDESSHAVAIVRSFENAVERYRLLSIGTVHDACAIMERETPALVLADYRLPDGNGWDLINVAAETCPVVIMTSKGNEEVAVQALKAGALDYVVKSPETFAQMPRIVGSALKSWGLLLDKRRAEETLRCYSRRLTQMEEELRKKLATELHDEIGRDVTALGMNLSLISSALTESAPEQLRQRVDDSVRLVQCISRTTRDIMVSLRPPDIDDFGLVPALRWHADSFTARTGVPVTIAADENIARLSAAVELTLFRIAQEALANTAKHAHASGVTITLKKTAGKPLFTVRDNGAGFAAGSVPAPRTSGWGLTIMRERAELAGGSFVIESQPGKGTAVTVELPLEEGRDAGSHSHS